MWSVFLIEEVASSKIGTCETKIHITMTSIIICALMGDTTMHMLKFFPLQQNQSAIFEL